MLIPARHQAIQIDGIIYDLDHLMAFSTSIPGEGIAAGTDLNVQVVFSNHVYTERAKHGDVFHWTDHNGTKRAFDAKRYEMSKMLGAAIRSKIRDNALTYVSTSYGGIDNLIFVEAKDGQTWAVVYCLKPHEDRLSVLMEVLSCHTKAIHNKRISRRSLSYFARKCLFDKSRIPVERKRPSKR